MTNQPLKKNKAKTEYESDIRKQIGKSTCEMWPANYKNKMRRLIISLLVFLFWIALSDSFSVKKTTCAFQILHSPLQVPDSPLTFRSLSFLRLHSSHSLTMRPHKIHVSSSRCDRFEEAEELETSEEPLLRREPLIDRMDLESASSNLREDTNYENGKLNLWLITQESLFMLHTGELS